MSKASLAALRKATRGLLYMSEKDAPFTAITLAEAPTAENIAALLKLPADSPVEETPFVKFFGELTKVRKWHAEDDKATVKRYQDLLATLREHLTSLKVFKVGQVRIKIAITGKSTEGNWLALVTDSLET